MDPLAPIGGIVPRFVDDFFFFFVVVKTNYRHQCQSTKRILFQIERSIKNTKKKTKTNKFFFDPGRLDIEKYFKFFFC